MSEPTKPRKKVNLHIHIDDDVAQGSYSNLMMINHTETEFVLDFVYVQPQQPKAKVHSRVICSPRHAKQLLQALTENISLYERNHGVIELPTPPGKLVH
jgi:hypothetical protein